MAIPKVFVSSTYIDLKDIRNQLSNFIKGHGLEPILFEKGNIAFLPDHYLDDSCYKEVKSCDVFILLLGGRYGSPTSDEGKINKSIFKKYNTITRKEYNAAVNLGIPIHIFVESSVFSEYHTYKMNRRNKNIKYAHVDNIQIFHLIEEIYEKEKNNFLKRFANGDEIISYLQAQWAGMFKEYIDNLRVRKKEISGKVRINSYKLFFLRSKQNNLSINNLSKRTGIKYSDLIKYERINKLNLGDNSVKTFPYSSFKNINELEKYFKVKKGYLYINRRDDFLSQYMLYYDVYKRKKGNPSEKATYRPFYDCKVVVFDFDGTLTIDNDKTTTWERIWLNLGYSIKDCALYHQQYMRKEITHKEWCKITLNHFRSKNLSKDDVSELSNSIKLVPGVKQTLEYLKQKDVKLYILSGSIDAVINEVLGELTEFFVDISSNKFVFDSSNTLTQIVSTKYDFEGKANYLRELIQQNEISPYEIMFVGNSCNDVWAYESGAQTLCVNPIFTDPNNAIQWNFFIRDMKDMNEILEYVLPKQAKGISA